MYEYHNNTLSIPARLLYEELALMAYKTYNIWCFRGKLKRTKEGKGAGNEAFVAFESLPDEFQEAVTEVLGPPQKANQIIFTEYIREDISARKFFNTYTLPTGEALPDKNKIEYIANAEVFNAITEVLGSITSRKRALNSKIKPWEKLTKVISEIPKHKWNHSLPNNERRLQDKYKKYINEGYQSLIHAGFGHKNSEKLNDEAKSWVLARWSDRVKKCASYNQLLREYNEMAKVTGWKPLISDSSLINFLTDPKIEPLWYGFRYGELKSKEKHMYQHKTKLPSMRDSLWYSDGTKLNYYYQDENGKMQTMQVYEVFDTYSEVFIGYHISQSEDYEAQYQAFKMALQVSGHKPFEIKFDNQGGTKKLEAQSFLGKISRLTRNTTPYNGKSKTIENAFGRFQAEYLKQDWFFTGMNIQTKKVESKANMEFIMENIKNLPTLEEVKKIYEQRRREWNEAKHPQSDKSRLELYLESYNPATPEVQIWDMMDMFWIKSEKTITCTPYGIKFQRNKVDYTYMVHDAEGLPDIDWLAENIDKKFIVSYDPDDMSMVQLYEDTPLGLRKVCMAETKIEIHRNAQEQEEWELSFIRKVENRIAQKRIENRDKMLAIQKQHGMSAEDYGLNEPRIKGLETSRKKEKTTIGKVQKKLSNAVLVDDNDDIYNDM